MRFQPHQLFVLGKSGQDPCGGQEVDESLGEPREVQGDLVLVTGAKRRWTSVLNHFRPFTKCIKTY